MAARACPDAPFSGSYAPADVTFLLKPVALVPTDVATKEAMIQSGRRHYSEMLSAEALPDPEYLRLYEAALARNGARLAQDVASLAAAIAERRTGGIVIVSLARAGTPIGVLLVRALRRMAREAVHYSISIIRGRGIDRQALAHIAARHDPATAVFVDGWTGKGAIAGELRASLVDRPHGFSPLLAVVADPAGVADLAASGDDYLIPSGLLGGIVSGLVSRSVLSATTVGPGDFHACVRLSEHAAHDRSRAFLDAVDALAGEAEPRALADGGCERATACEALVASLMARANVGDRNRIKPGIAEATRAVLRRVPDRLYLRDPADPDVAHLVHLASARGVPVEPLPADAHFRAVAVIRSVGAE